MNSAPDTLTVAGDNGVVRGRGGSDTLIGDGAGNTMYGGDGEDELIGNGGDDYLNGGIGDDILYSKTHPSSINAATTPTGQDTLVGGPGVD